MKELPKGVYNRDEAAFLFKVRSNSDIHSIHKKHNNEKDDIAETFKIKQKDQKYAVHSCYDYMACFGQDGQDLSVSAHCNRNSDSSIEFHDDFASYDIPKCQNEAYLNGGNAFFQIKDIEVFQC